LHDVISDEYAQAAGLSSRRHAPTNLIFLTFYLIVLFVPLQFILASLAGSPLAISPVAMIELSLLAIFFIYLVAGKPRKIWPPDASFLAMLWFALCAICIFADAVTQR
jgi:hypothetical protein